VKSNGGGEKHIQETAGGLPSAVNNLEYGAKGYRGREAVKQMFVASQKQSKGEERNLETCGEKHKKREETSPP